MSRVVCAWCGVEQAAGAAPEDDVSHGLCAACAAGFGALPVDELSTLSQREYDQLPLGLIELDRGGVVRAYSANEGLRSGLRARNVLGRNFFRDVAPCTQVHEFEGRFLALALDREPRSERFEFVFRFASGDRLVRIAMASDPVRSRVTVLVRDA